MKTWIWAWVLRRLNSWHENPEKKHMGDVWRYEKCNQKTGIINPLQHPLHNFHASRHSMSRDSWISKFRLPDGQQCEQQIPEHYCWWLKSCTTWDVWNPINNGINYQPQLVNRISAINSITICLTCLTILNSNPFLPACGTNTLPQSVQILSRVVCLFCNDNYGWSANPRRATYPPQK